MRPPPRTFTWMFSTACAASIALVTASAAHAADPGKLLVKVDQPGAKISPTFYGLMTEEINFSYDGGLYGELIQNRIFKNTPPPPAHPRQSRCHRPRSNPPPRTAAPNPNLVHWSLYAPASGKGAIDIDTNDPVNTIALTNSLRLDITSDGQNVGVANDGYWGIPIKPNSQYKASFYAKSGNGFSGPLTVSLVADDGKIITSQTIPALTNAWQKYQTTLATGGLTPTAQAKFVISAQNHGTLWLSLVSLFPPTYHDRPNGFRPDLMEKLAGMQPAFLRFPGGNYVEGNDWDNFFNWKKTIGPYEDRPGHMSPWRYRSTDGMGLLEFLYWCEDLKMEPVLAVFAGHTLGNGPNVAVTGDALKPYVQDAVDEIEYVTGDASTKWGGQRAKDGHPEPFKLTYVEIGNEDNLSNGTPTYNERFTAFYDAIKAKYPKLQIMSTMPPASPLSMKMDRRPDVIDDHLYASPASMAVNSRRFDNYDRSNPKIFMGEWAANEGQPTPDFNSALGDAAFLSGLERNADVVIMECYAPLFVNVNPGGRQWNTNLIGYDALNSFGSPSYYMQKIYAENRGDTVLPIDIQPQTQPPAPPPPASAPAGARGRGRGPQPQAPALAGSAARVDASGDIILKIVNPYDTPQQMQIDLQGAKIVNPNATVEVMTGQPTDQNSLAEPIKIVPRTTQITNAAPQFTYEFPGDSITIIRIKTK